MRKIEQTITTVEIAEMMDIKHYQVLEKLEGTKTIKGIIQTLTDHKIMVSDYFTESTYQDGSGKRNKCYLVTKMGCDFLANKFTGEKGILFTAKYVKRFHEMEDRVRIETESLSPELQMFKQIFDTVARQELEAQRTRKMVEATEKTIKYIKAVVVPVSEDWRNKVNDKINRIQHASGIDYRALRTDLYLELEKRAGCDLNTRLRNRKKNMEDRGCTKTEVNNLNKMDIIETDKKLKEIFLKNVSEYEIKYCA